MGAFAESNHATESRHAGNGYSQEDVEKTKAKVYLLDSATKSERIRLSMQNEALKVLRGGKLLLCPLKEEPKRVLDIATGTANWAFDYLEEHPQANVLGVDITNAVSKPPPNFHLQIMDIQKEWAFNQPFDLIHGGLLFTLQIDWPRLMRQAYANLRPGGWLEFQEYAIPICVGEGTDAGSVSCAWVDACHRGLDGLGHNWQQARNIDRWMKETGFVEIQVEKFRVCYGDWSDNPRERAAGILYENEVNTRYHFLWRSVIGKGLGWAPAVVDAVWNERHREALDGKAKLWHDHLVIYGRKPE